MAILSNGKFYGFLCSVKETGRKLSNGVKEYVEDFVSGFAGHGWKLWKTVAGFFRLEIDELVVRRTMTIFELLIQKIRAVKGAIAITQGNGKIKTARLTEDETAYLITLEEDDMSFVEHDFLRCQEFTGGQRFYHVEVASVEGGVIRIPVSEFDGSSIPEPGDEIVQFGNSSHDQKYSGRHSAIYMHADESGQPAIDVMFDIYSKAWTNCVKVRVGGDIPDSGGLKGFYCENGMIKCVDSTGHTTYCLHPNGTAELGDGAAIFRPDKSGHIADGAIKWEWSKDKKKYVCTMGDVLLSWDNLSDEVKENLKGEPGSIEELPEWFNRWNGYATELGEEYIVTPTMFSGTKSADGKLTGIAQGRDCITIDGVKRTGIFALVDNEVVFEMDPITKRYLFRGRIEVESGHISIAGGKTLLEEDGSGKLAGGKILWTKEGYLLSDSYDLDWSRFTRTIAGQLNPLILDLPFIPDKYFKIIRYPYSKYTREVVTLRLITYSDTGTIVAPSADYANPGDTNISGYTKTRDYSINSGNGYIELYGTGTPDGEVWVLRDVYVGTIIHE